MKGLVGRASRPPVVRKTHPTKNFSRQSHMIFACSKTMKSRNNQAGGQAHPTFFSPSLLVRKTHPTTIK
jgi:hypothetical protein